MQLSQLGEALSGIARRIRDQNLLWLLAMLIVAILGRLGDRTTFIAVLGVGAAIIVLRIWLDRGATAPAGNIPLAISFKGQPSGDTQLLSCSYELRDSQNALKGAGELAFSFEVNSWVCFLTHGIAPTDIIRINMGDRDGRNWETGPFRPLFASREAGEVP